MKDNIIWWILGIILGYIFLTSGDALAEQIKFIIFNNLILVLVAIVIAIVLIQRRK